jgi:hypothetical protein
VAGGKFQVNLQENNPAFLFEALEWMFVSAQVLDFTS